ncbi:bifunctional phosphoribosylaminoimidazolecarboxamide formyltransferase/IMP cyclohydrolase [Legionella israelensis]|uniref:Bifunctional purine biosynthesis protein PurH n=1 Tax=Legionella israelensis TaxID=454 RepID=A0A0W0V2T4_9GAMM|nr:bifunctional phosphoribosylaminoimidazolecarboxamide formyltransferase/IMP cyclohydrolase [Legionella israelensis]KTD14418.1 bifunctional phosphoribosylaminoimidazolecarboxamide formyltransferase/IMP cyclohydrolase [Legionella israelensis]QBS09368.1 bifunctional phosphoribosylaminoimidazolecarboxamide formyltransferase/IMP cyclohydrolase [Legionella israelensis]SCX90761.1 IMP cyclohydrolase [Legionella israelensis DSM 19235]STX60268.1 phosphoribosylaminoimidazolecarboxamide formyltransferase
MAKKTTIPFCPKRALISVSDKKNIVKLAKQLQEQDIEIIATGNTAALLRKKGLSVTEVSDYTGFPEILDGRVKTLHPAIHAGILARGSQDSEILAQHGLQAIDLVIVNLYPFEQVISNPNCNFNRAIENIDIGGPTMIRSAAKNHAHTYVIVSPEDYKELMKYLHSQKVPANWAFHLAKKAFAHTAAYDAAISNYLGTLDEHYKPSNFPSIMTRQFIKKETDLRYGENPHQQAIFYTDKNSPPGSLAGAELLQGKELSYNNLLDADAALNCVKSFSRDKATCVIVKHANPCGIATSNDTINAYLRAFQADSTSAFGGIIAFNQTLTADTAAAILDKQFVEVIIAPEIHPEALAVFKQKDKIRVLQTGSFPQNQEFCLDLRQVSGGLLVQEHDALDISLNELQTVTLKRPTDNQLKDLLFAWQAVKHVKSNAIVYAKSLTTIGIGAGQSSRVMSARIGLWQAEQFGFDTEGAVMASDAFIPFPDTLELAANAGISAVIQPGGSIRDKEIIEFANANDIAMVFTGIRHFKH